jgi:hypothetical protein
METLNQQVIKELTEMKAIGIRVSKRAFDLAKTENYTSWLPRNGKPCMTEIAVLTIVASNVGKTEEFLRNEPR